MTLLRTLVLLGAVACVSCGAAGEGAADGGPKTEGGSLPDHSAPIPRDAGVEARADVGLPDAPSEAARDTGSPYPAAHPPMPQVTNFGGPVLAHPRVVPIFYAGDPLMSTVETFLTNLTTASYWSGATGEYGVGAITITPPIVVNDTPPDSIADADIQTWIANHIDAAMSVDAGVDAGTPWPLPDGNTIYAVFYPDATTVTLGGLESCTYFGGYHDELAYSGGSTPYAVLPRCSTFVLLPGADTTDILTGATSHELVEASTDPFPVSNPAYAIADFIGSGWSEVMVGGELGDMCVLEPSSFTKPTDLGFLVQRTWSNANAAASHDPCAPVPAGEVYFSAVPDLSNAEMYPGQYIDGLSVPPGSSKTVALHLFSDGPMAGPWTLSVVEAGEEGTQIPPDPDHQLSFSLDQSTGNNGDVVNLTVTRKPLAGGESSSGLAFRIESTLGTETRSYWGVAGY